MKTDEKAARVQAMFAGIARRYDLANDLISFGQHRAWKRRAADLSRIPAGGHALDLCTGTGDLAILLAQRAGSGGRVVGVDFCAPMLEIARNRRRIAAADQAPIRLLQARAEEIPLESGRFDGCTVAFGLRNVSDIDAALAEVWRVLKPAGRLVSLDCSTPDLPIFAPLFAFYFNRIVPIIGALVNQSRSAYTYLPESVASFPQKHEMCRRMRSAGFSTATYYQICGGAVAIHVAEK
ncbi:MAG TPA: bifunctional demethylmenaquinone methyltransferase/2-methoxy-6-polyprenyl-1,4-benzoquinol methylase UbiE [Armatimonadota bacterium]|nr:bifunctional demethylmenaquinone methyltransferase/2-methoxy-6-polyprenyl-1,4-benzoquinol methylase UbiE [Armatimonadota bacterium]